MSALTSVDALAISQQMGLLESEFREIERELGRIPSLTEIAVFAGMWSEHCSYKSTRQWLWEMPSRSDRVLAGPGSHAGTVDVGDGWAVAFKIESHNHPSAVEPYQGAATGVGGILRDIIAQGARPCAIMDALCFGAPDDAQTLHLMKGIVDGIAGYGNAFGVANVGGRTRFDPRYEGNPLVNALAAGLVRHDALRSARASGIGNSVVYVGAATGRDGILGAAFASDALGDDAIEDRPHVQVGDPFTGKKVMEACLSFTPEMGMIACQDMGASGITCAAVEMAAAGGVGMHIDLETIPVREDNMTPQEIMLSESQERFMFVVEAGFEEAALEHFRRHSIHAVVCGRVVAGENLRVEYRDEVVVDVPAALVADGAPLTNWRLAPRLPSLLPYPAFPAEPDLGASLLTLMGDPSISDVRGLYSHYDQTVGNRTVRGPGTADAAVLKLPDSRRGFALSIACRGDWCAVDPYAGAQALVAAAARSLACAGAEVIAITDGINVGSPRDPTENLRLRETIRGISDALKGMNIPVTGGNCSLYNESSSGPIPPTPIIGALGVIDDVRRVPIGALRQGDIIFFLGELQEKHSVCRYGCMRTGFAGGRPVPVDFEAEQRLRDLIVAQCREGRIRASKSSSAGGIAVALAKLCMRGHVGARVTLPWSADGRRDWQLFGEYPAQAWVSVLPQEADAFEKAARKAETPCFRAGRASGGQVDIQGGLSMSLGALRTSYRQGLGARR